MKTIAITCVLSCMLLTNVASADMTYDVTGVVTDIYTFGGVSSPIVVGSTLTGQFSFDPSTAPDYVGANWSSFAGAVTSASLGFSGSPAITFAGPGDAVTSNVGIGDSLELYLLGGSTLDGLPSVSRLLRFVDPTSTLFSTDPPPLVNPDHPLLNSRPFIFSWEDPLNPAAKYFKAVGTFTATPQPVPVPGAVLLGTIGLGMVGWLKGRKNA